MNVEKFKHIKKIFKETIKNPFYVPSFQNSNYPSRIVEMRRKEKVKKKCDCEITPVGNANSQSIKLSHGIVV